MRWTFLHGHHHTLSLRFLQRFGFVLGIDRIADGDQDLIVANRNAPALLFINRWADAARNNWLKVRLIGDNESTAIGAVVKVQTGNRIQAQTFSLCNSCLSCYAGPLLFGIGNANQVDAVGVVWPGGESSHITGINANQVIEVHFPTSARTKK